MSDQPEQTPQEKMNFLLAEIEVNKSKESLKQEKSTTTQIKIQTELYEQVSKLDSQTAAVENVQKAITSAEQLQDAPWADDTLKRAAIHLVKDAVKRARASYK